MKIKTLVLVGLTTFATPTLALAGPGEGDKKAAPAPVGELDRMELVHRHHVNVMEIEMGKMAKTRGTAPVKKYGSMLVGDHTKADKDVRALAKAKGITLADHPVTGDDDFEAHKQSMELMDKLMTLDGPDFDRAYLAAMVEGHQKEIARVTAAAPQVKDAKIKALLDKTVGSLQKHADGAAKLQTPPAATTK